MPLLLFSTLRGGKRSEMKSFSSSQWKTFAQNRLTWRLYSFAQYPEDSLTVLLKAIIFTRRGSATLYCLFVNV